VPDVIPPIVGRDLFLRANVALEANRGRTAPGGEAMEYLFTHMLVCGDCGSYMRGQPMPHGKGKGYLCGKYKTYGSKACHRNRVMERQLWQAILDKILAVVLDPARLDAREAELKRRLDAERSAGGEQKIRQQIDQLERDIRQGGERLIRLPEDMLPIVTESLRSLERERDSLQSRLKELETGTTKEQAILTEARKQLWQLREGLEGDDEELQAAVVRLVISKIEIHFEHEESHGKRSPTGKKRLFSNAAKAVLYVRPGLGIVSLDAFDLSKSGSLRWTRACQ
jgi:site-specific DNA recombinase